MTADWTHNGSGRLTYIGTPTRIFAILLSPTVKRQGGSNYDGKIHIAKNGSVVTESTVLRQFSNAEGLAPTWCLTDISTNDYVEMYVENTSSTDDARITDVIFGVLAIQ